MSRSAVLGDSLKVATLVLLALAIAQAPSWHAGIHAADAALAGGGAGIAPACRGARVITDPAAGYAYLETIYRRCADSQAGAARADILRAIRLSREFLATWPDERWQAEVERRICRLHFLLQEPRLAYAALRDYAVAVRRRELGSVATNGLSPSVLREEGDHWLAQGRAATALTLYDELVEIARGTEDGDYAAFQAAKCLSAMGMGRASLRLLAELARREGNGTWIMKARDEAVAGFVSSGKFEEAVLMTEHLLANSTTAGIRAARMYELAHLFYAWGPAHHGQSVQWLWRILALHPSTPAGASALTLLERIANLRLSALTHPVPPASPTKESP